MIEQLTIKDFKSHSSSNIIFYSRLNVFLGEVGAGKTSVLEAISLALFGKYAGAVVQKELIRRGKEKAKITLFFSIKSNRYKLERMIYSNKAQKAKLWMCDQNKWKLAVEGATAVSKSIEGLLEIDASTFLTAIYASQGAIKEMLQSQPGLRRKQLDKLLGIDVYDNIWQVLGDSRHILTKELMDAQEKASGYEVIGEQIKTLEKHRMKNEEELKTVKNNLKRLLKKLKPAEVQLDALDHLKSKQKDLETKIEGIGGELQRAKSTIDSITLKINKAEEADKIYQQNKDFIQTKKILEKEKARIEKLLHTKKTTRKLLESEQEALKETKNRRTKIELKLQKLSSLENESKKLNEIKKGIKELRDKESDLKKKLDQINEAITKASLQIQNEEKKAQRVKDLGECPTCLQDVPQQHKQKIKVATDEQISKLKTNYNEQEEKRNQIRNELKNTIEELGIKEEAEQKSNHLNAQIEILASCRKDFEDTENDLKRIKIKIHKIKKELEHVKETKDDLSNILKELENVSKKAELAKEAEKRVASKTDFIHVLSQEKQKIEKLKKTLKDLISTKKTADKDYDKTRHEELKELVQHLRKEQARTKEALERIKTSIEEDTTMIKKENQTFEEKKQANNKTKKLKVENNILEIFRDSLRDVIQPVMRKSNVLKVSESFQTFYQELSNDSIDFAAIDEEGNLEVTRNGEPSPVKSLSGGETTCAALALRLAICSSLTQNQFLLLDEPTIHLDEPYKFKLREFLSTHDFQQLIVVTHDNTFDSLPAQIFTVKKIAGESIVEAINPKGEH